MIDTTKLIDKECLMALSYDGASVVLGFKRLSDIPKLTLEPSLKPELLTISRGVREAGWEAVISYVDPVIIYKCNLSDFLSCYKELLNQFIDNNL